ncbi:hypothetical protein BsWGS_12654 [Bradybaena similaris]
MSRKILTRNLSVHLDDAELEHICSGVSSDTRTPSDDLNQKDRAGNIPDIVSSISETSQSHDSMEDHKDPDIVRSNSSFEEKSPESQISSYGAVSPGKRSATGQGSASSFSSSGGSSSSQDPDGAVKRSTVSSLCSPDNNIPESKVPVARETSWLNCLYNQDSVFAQESEDVPDSALPYEPWQQADLSRHSPSPITEAGPARTSKQHDINTIFRCSQKGQEARNRFSSSGYGTGSGESSQGTSASKSSAQMSQESFSKVDTVLQRGVDSSTICSEEPKHAANILHSRAALSDPANLSCGANFSVLKVLHSHSLKPAFQNPSSDSRDTADVSTQSKSIITDDLRRVSHVATDGPSLSSESQSSEHRQQQAHKHQVLMNINPDQVDRQSPIVVQNVRQPPLNTAPPSWRHIQGSAVPQNIGQSQVGFNQQRQSPIHISGSVIKNPQATTNSLSIVGPQPQAAAESIGKLSTVYENMFHMRLPLQHLAPSNGSLNCVTAPMSSSNSGSLNCATAPMSSSSCGIPSSVEYRWTVEPSDASLARNLLQSGPGFSESSVETRYNLESLLKTEDQLIGKPAVAARTSSDVHLDGARNIPMFHQLLPGSSDSSVLAEIYSLDSSANNDLPDKSLWEKLEMSMRCHETNCCVSECSQIKAVIAVLQDERNDVHSLSSTHKNVLLTMFHHMAYECDHPKCPYPWCGERVDSHGLSRDECLLIMKQRMENFAEHCRLLKRPVKYMKLKTTFPYDTMPMEDLDWMRLCMLGSSRRTLLVKPLQFYSSQPLSDSKYWVIKKVYLTDEEDNWSVYARLREVKHHSIASLLWAASFEDHMLVCSMYEGFSLQDYLPSLPAPDSRFIPVFCIMQQLISAIRHVHSLGIVYLNWTSKNMLVTYHSETYFVIKLSNFSCSVLLQPPDGKQACYDGGFLLLALPWHVVTPELRDNIKVEFVSDVWGIGCLLHELATGYPVLHDHRHINDQEFAKSLVQPQPPATCPELLEMFAACWQPDPSKRVCMSGLEMMLIQAYSHHLRVTTNKMVL